LIIELSSPDLERQLEQARLQMELTTQRLNRIAGDQTDLSSRVVLEGQLARNKASIDALEADIERLSVKAPIAGVLRDVDHELRAGDWLDDVTPLARLVSKTRVMARGYVNEEQVWRLDVGSEAVFVPEDPLLGRFRGTVTEIEPAGSRTIEVAYLASVFGGAVPSDRSPDGEIRPRGGRNMVRVALADAYPDRVVRGTLHLTGRRESFASAVWRQLLKVIIRESSA
jgi:putative peptide zinc metalloprotease protein